MLEMRPQPRQCRDSRTLGTLAQESRDLLDNDPLRLADSLMPRLAASARHPFQVVEGVKKHTIEAIGKRINVPRQAGIDDNDRPVAPEPQCRPRHLRIDHWRPAAQARQHNIGARHRFRQPLEFEGMAVEHPRRDFGARWPGIGDAQPCQPCLA